MIKSNHLSSLNYINEIPNIIKNPDYIGINPKEQGNTTIELVKCYSENQLLAIKLDVNNNYLYVATMHELQNSKINRRLHSGRLKKIN